jgi:hypothetical protein
VVVVVVVFADMLVRCGKVIAGFYSIRISSWKYTIQIEFQLLL